MKIGDIRVDPIYDGIGTEMASEILSRPGIDDPWACHPDVRKPDGTVDLDLGGFLVRTRDRVVLVDVGAGRIDNGKYRGGAFLESLRSLGVSPEEVTDVALTHLHFDHVGWTTSKQQIVFPNATYRAHAADWAHFVEADDADAGAIRKLSPLTEQLELFDAEITLAPGVDARPSPGHTPGSTVYILSSGDERALLIGDIAHSVVELAEPDWEAVFDVDPVAATAVRSQIAEDACDTSTLVAAAHFPDLAFGRVITTPSGRRWIAL